MPTMIFVTMVVRMRPVNKETFRNTYGDGTGVCHDKLVLRIPG